MCYVFNFLSKTWSCSWTKGGRQPWFMGRGILRGMSRLRGEEKGELCVNLNVSTFNYFREKGEADAVGAFEYLTFLSQVEQHCEEGGVISFEPLGNI